jgi:HSP20 family protein
MAMTLWRKRRPFEGLTSWFDDIDQWFDTDLFTRPVERTWAPALDIQEQDETYLVKADLPGVKREDIHLELRNGYLTLKGERKYEHEDKEDHYRRIERTHGTFQRILKVPEGLTEKDIKAKYRDGVLEVTIPTPEVETPKTINVKIG